MRARETVGVPCVRVMCLPSRTRAEHPAYERQEAVIAPHREQSAPFLTAESHKRISCEPTHNTTLKNTHRHNFTLRCVTMGGLKANLASCMQSISDSSSAMTVNSSIASFACSACQQKYTSNNITHKCARAHAPIARP